MKVFVLMLENELVEESACYASKRTAEGAKLLTVAMAYQQALTDKGDDEDEVKAYMERELRVIEFQSVETPPTCRNCESRHGCKFYDATKTDIECSRHQWSKA